MRRCIGEPVSWLRLERYGLGELAASEARALESHLAQCTVCRDCFVHITGDVRPALALAPPPSAAKRRGAGRARWLGGGALLSAALAAWLMSQRTLEPPAAHGVKGGELALTLVRVDASGRQLAADHFAPEDRFKALVTCAPGAEGVATLIVFEDGATSVPLAPQTLEACGNRRALAGAFRLSGGPAEVCVVLSDAASPKLMAATSPAALPEAHACVPLTPVD